MFSSVKQVFRRMRQKKKSGGLLKDKFVEKKGVVLESVYDSSIMGYSVGLMALKGHEITTTVPRVLFDLDEDEIRYFVDYRTVSPEVLRLMARLYLVEEVVAKLKLRPVIPAIALVRGTDEKRQRVVGYALGWVKGVENESVLSQTITGTKREYRIEELVHPVLQACNYLDNVRKFKDEGLEKEIFRRIPAQVYEKFCVAFYVLGLWDTANRNIMLSFRADGSVWPVWIDISEALSAAAHSIGNYEFIRWKNYRKMTSKLGARLAKIEAERLVFGLIEENVPENLFEDYFGVDRLSYVKLGLSTDLRRLLLPAHEIIYVRGDRKAETTHPLVVDMKNVALISDWRKYNQFTRFDRDFLDSVLLAVDESGGISPVAQLSSRIHKLQVMYNIMEIGKVGFTDAFRATCLIFVQNDSFAAAEKKVLKRPHDSE